MTTTEILVCSAYFLVAWLVGGVLGYEEERRGWRGYNDVPMWLVALFWPVAAAPWFGTMLGRRFRKKAPDGR